MNRSLCVAVGLCVGAMLGGCAGVPQIGDIAKALPIGGGSSSWVGTAIDVSKDVVEATRNIPETEEIQMGERLMSGVLGAAPLYPNDRVQRYVNQVGRWVASHSERPNLPWRFAVVESPLVNAGAAPGGQIYISTALLFRMRSEAELAGALAHEIAHVVQKHHLKTYSAKLWGNVAKTGGLALFQAKAGTGGGVLGQTAKNMLVEFGAEAMKDMLLTPLDRSEEEQADRMAMVLAARAGYDPYGLPASLQILQDVSGEQSGLSVLFSTHPTPKDRLESLDRNFGNSMEKYANQAKLTDRFTAVILGETPRPAAAPMPSPVTKPAPPAPRPAARGTSKKP